jgi:glycosyltransferase involved in cell wall biosynthesis
MNEYQRGHGAIVACQTKRRVASPPVRIIHVSDCYAPRTGGIETQVRSLAHAQHSQGDEVAVITATPGHTPRRSGDEYDEGVRVFRVAMSLPGEIPVHPRTAHHVRRIVHEFRPDVVHVHDGVVSPFAWSALRELHRLGVPRVVTVHSMWGPLAAPLYGSAGALLPWRDRDTVVTAVSKVAADGVSAALKVRVSVLPNGIDPTQWPPVEVEAQPGVLRVVSVLRLAPRKRAAALLRVCARAALRLAPDIALEVRIIGDGPERRRSQAWIDRCGLSASFTLLGRLDGAEIRREFARSDVFAQASVRESFGIAALEARTSGVPVVARSQTGSGEFVTTGVNGLLADDDDGLVDALCLLAHDRELLDRMRVFNSENPPSQTWPEVVSIAQAAYDRARGIA